MDENTKQETETDIQTSNDVVETSEQVQTSNEETTVTQTDETGHTELPTTDNDRIIEVTEEVEKEKVEPEPAPIIDSNPEPIKVRPVKQETSPLVYLAILLLIIALIYVIRIAFYGSEES